MSITIENRRKNTSAMLQGYQQRGANRKHSGAIGVAETAPTVAVFTRMGRVRRVDDNVGDWFLTRSERGNAATDVHSRDGGSSSWSEGNRVRPLVHGATYFARLQEELAALRAGD